MVAVGRGVSVGGMGVSVGRTGVSVGGTGVLVGRGVLVGKGVAVAVGLSGVPVDVGVWVGSGVLVGTGVAVRSGMLVAVAFSDVETTVTAMAVGACVGWVGPQADKSSAPAATVTSRSINNVQALLALVRRARPRPSSLIGHLPDTCPPHGNGCIPQS